MKTYKHIDTTHHFSISISWDERRTILRIESGPTDEPQEMVAQMEGLSPHGAMHAIKLWIGGMVDGNMDLTPALEALRLLP